MDSGYQSVACLPVDTDQIVSSLGVPTALYHESEIDGDALITNRQTHCCFLPCWLFPELGSETDGARLKLVGSLNSGIPFTYRCMIERRRKLRCPKRWCQSIRNADRDNERTRYSGMGSESEFGSPV
jgi:hypothetical protein